MMPVPSPRDLRYEAAFLRAALLVGLVHEREVPPWAEASMGLQPALDGALATSATTRVELSAMRDALAAIADAPEPVVVDALLAATALECWGPVPDPIRVLADLRRFLQCRPPVHDGIRDFDARVLLASGGVAGATRPARADIAPWLDAVRPSVRFLVPCTEPYAAAAFVAALSRALARMRRGLAPAPHAWVQAGPVETIVTLDEPAWAVAASAFGPLPPAARIPYVPVIGMTIGAPVQLDEPRGMDEVRRQLTP